VNLRELRAPCRERRDELFGSDTIAATLMNNCFPESSTMNLRRTRQRRTLGLESLEIRNSPSHSGVTAHAASLVRPIHAAAHVRHVADSEVNHQKELTEARSSIESSRDMSNDPGNSGSTSNDAGSIDPNSDR
jgi:hypothetical protein